MSMAADRQYLAVSRHNTNDTNSALSEIRADTKRR